MRVLIDAGNSRIKWTDASEVHDQLDVNIVQADVDCAELAQALVTDRKPDAIWLASVRSGDWLTQLRRALTDVGMPEPAVLDATYRAPGMTNQYANPESMGADRWAALIGARRHVSDAPVVVVDAGTAITVDTLNCDGEFTGGLILPGADLSRRSLLERTDRIHSANDACVELTPFGLTTGECVNRGARYAAAGGVRLALADIESRLGTPPEIMISGGGASELIDYLPPRSVHKPWLVLEGLAAVAEWKRC